MPPSSSSEKLTVRYRNKHGAGCMATISTRAEAESALKGEHGEKEVTITNACGVTVGVRVKENGQWNWSLDLAHFP